MSGIARPSFLMCPPDHYAVEYVINPWMANGRGRVSQMQAVQQWHALREVLSTHLGAEIVTVEPYDGLPDMAFTANGGLVVDSVFVPSRFRYTERAGEEQHFTAWATGAGYRICALPDGIAFEGAGDALFDRALPILWLGHGFRTDATAADALSAIVEPAGFTVHPLRLVNPRYYHLDTCFCPLSNGALLYYPDAFAEESVNRIEAIVGPKYRIRVSDEDAEAFACNAVNAGDTVVLYSATAALRRSLSERGFRCFETPLDEFLYAGGSAKCLTLRLDDP